MPTILVTCFEAFGEEAINPSQEVVKRLGKRANLRTATLSVMFGRSFDQLKLLLLDKPDYVLLLGQAGGRQKVTLEKVAINYANVRNRDPDGCITGNTIKVGGDVGIFSTLPVESLCQKVVEKDLPCALSFSAGTYVCNYLLYCALDYCAINSPNTKVGFIHLPYCAEQVQNKPATPYLDLTTSLAVVETLLDELS